MDKNRVKGKMDEVAGRAKRLAGEWTGGAAQEIIGRAENAWSKVKDAARDVTRDKDREDRDIEGGRKHDAA